MKLKLTYGQDADFGFLIFPVVLTLRFREPARDGKLVRTLAAARDLPEKEVQNRCVARIGINISGRPLRA